MRRIAQLLAVGLIPACFSPEVPISEDTGTGGSSSTTTTAQTSASTDSNGTTSDGSETADTAENLAPSVTLTLNGEEAPGAITDHATYTLAANVSDEGEISSVEFWQENTLLQTQVSPPYELSIAFSSVDSGLREYTAVVVDDGGLEAEDSLEVSVNIAGGNVEELEYDLFSGAIGMLGPTDVVAGALIEVDGRIYVSATQSNGNGLLLSTLPELETQWQVEFSGPLWSPSTPINDDRLAVAVSEAGDWVVHVIERSNGARSHSWTLGPQPTEFGALGPQITSTPAGVLATTTPTAVGLYDVEGNSLGAQFSVGNGVVTELITASDGELAYVSFGDVFDATAATCATNSDFCAQAVEPGRGAISWVTGLSEQFAGIHRIAPTSDGGSYVAANVSHETSSFELLKLTPQGVISETQFYGEQAVDSSGDRVMALSPDNKGGVVACGGAGFLIDEDSSPEPFVSAFDPNLNMVWSARDFVDATDGAYALACAATDEAVYVYGLRDAEVGFIDDEPYVVGDAWLARISL